MAMIKFDPASDLLAQKAALEAQIAELDTREPVNMESEEYDLWADEHEQLEDMLDEILDLLDP
ncbi:MAG: hypothetical protein E7447_02855 [Ruminococcaceae bacterium]|nr:hypothetical protein [Oscillospiraceae bacterium]